MMRRPWAAQAHSTEWLRYRADLKLAATAARGGAELFQTSPEYVSQESNRPGALQRAAMLLSTDPSTFPQAAVDESGV